MPAVHKGLFADVLTAVAGIIIWAVFALVLHAWLIGVRPFVQ
jgi:uncharacterized membrane protein